MSPGYRAAIASGFGAVASLARDDSTQTSASAEQRMQGGEPRVGVGVESNAAFVGVAPRKGQLGLSFDDRTGVAQRSTLGRLDQHDIGAEIGKEASAQLATVVGAIDDTDAREWQLHGGG